MSQKCQVSAAVTLNRRKEVCRRLKRRRQGVSPVIGCGRGGRGCRSCWARFVDLSVQLVQRVVILARRGVATWASVTREGGGASGRRGSSEGVLRGGVGR